MAVNVWQDLKAERAPCCNRKLPSGTPLAGFIKLKLGSHTNTITSHFTTNILPPSMQISQSHGLTVFNAHINNTQHVLGSEKGGREAEMVGIRVNQPCYT